MCVSEAMTEMQRVGCRVYLLDVKSQGQEHKPQRAQAQVEWLSCDPP